MRTLARPPAALAATLVLAATLLVGCGDDGSSNDPDPEPSSESTGGPAPTDEPTDGPTEPTASATVTPASGEPMRLPNVSAVAPAEWPVRPFTEYIRAAEGPGLATRAIYLSDAPRLQEVPLRKLAETAIEGAGYVKAPPILPETSLDGMPVYHYAGSIGGSSVVEAFGGYHERRLIGITFLFPTTVPKAEREEIVDSVLATFELR